SFLLQAEDGIRDRNVTGVQTCALPILGLIPVRYMLVAAMLSAYRRAGLGGARPWAPAVRGPGGSPTQVRGARKDTQCSAMRSACPRVKWVMQVSSLSFMKLVT